MEKRFSGLKKFFYRFIRIGLDESVPDELARVVMVHNNLILVSTLCLSPFPILFWILGMNQGLYLCAASLFSILLQMGLNYYQLFFWGRLLGIVTAFVTFVLGIIFYGYDAGFTYGIMALYVLPILYFRKVSERLGAIILSTVSGLLLLYGFQEHIPLFSPPEQIIWLHIPLLFFFTLLVISYFLSLDWISSVYESRNNQLVEQLTLRNEELQNFSYTTSHDLKQPLQTILSFVGLFQQKKASQLDEEAQTFLNFIQKASTRLDHLIDALLKHSVLGQSESFEPVDCNMLVEEVKRDLSQLIQESQAQVRVTGTLPTVLVNRVELGTVFQNLISNAIKFKQAGLSPAIEIRAEDAQRHWVFHVKDNGIGIEPFLHEKIFQMFQVGHLQAEFAGTGIGLASCKKIINFHGGEIWVESEVGKGATFHFTLKKQPQPKG